jgi:holo-[acyl-carrier protein] synthase
VTGGVGIDLVEVARVERALERRPRLAERLFTDAEREFAAGRRRPAMHLAARFAAKEAAIKALGGPAVAPRDIEVVGGGSEAPRLSFHGAVAAISSGAEWEVSLTHTADLAAAVVIARS